MQSTPTTKPGASGRKSRSDAAEVEVIFSTLSSLVAPLAQSLPANSEVVLHDLRKFPDSIACIAGDLTGREVGGSAIELPEVDSESLDTTVGYRSHHPGGTEMRTSTIVVRDSSGTPVAAVCINSDTRVWHLLAELAQMMLPSTASGSTSSNGRETWAPADIEELARHVLARGIEETGVPVNLMQKQHKVDVIRGLKERGFFLLRESVEAAADALGVTRFTVYKYLNEIADTKTPGS